MNEQKGLDAQFLYKYLNGCCYRKDTAQRTGNKSGTSDVAMLRGCKCFAIPGGWSNGFVAMWDGQMPSRRPKNWDADENDATLESTESIAIFDAIVKSDDTFAVYPTAVVPNECFGKIVEFSDGNGSLQFTRRSRPARRPGQGQATRRRRPSRQVATGQKSQSRQSGQKVPPQPESRQAETEANHSHTPPQPSTAMDCTAGCRTTDARFRHCNEPLKFAGVGDLHSSPLPAIISPEVTMRAFAVRQPFTWLIVNGYKTTEYRSWPTKFRGLVLIHASLKLHADAAHVVWDCEQVGIPLPKAVETGGIVGVVDVIDCLPTAEGGYGFLLADARPLGFHPFKGRLGFFETGLELKDLE